MKTSATITKIMPALLAAQKEIHPVVKDSANPFFKSKYADLSAFLSLVKPALNKHGIILLQPVVDINGEEYVETHLFHESGEFLSDAKKVIAAKQNDPQANGAGVTYARRIGLQAFLAIEAVDDDGNTAARHPPEEYGKGPFDESSWANLSEPPRINKEPTPEQRANCEHIWLKDQYKPGKFWCKKCKTKK